MGMVGYRPQKKNQKNYKNEENSKVVEIQEEIYEKWRQAIEEKLERFTNKNENTKIVELQEKIYKMEMGFRRKIRKNSQN